MAGTRLQLGLRENDRPATYHYDCSLFEREGRYGSALRRMSALMGGGHYQDWSDEGRKLALHIVHQCEEARRWSALENDAARDRVDYFDSLSLALEDAAKLVNRLRGIESRHPYFFRHAFNSAVESLVEEAVPLDVQVPDQNHSDGGPVYQADAATRAHIQHTLIWQIALFKLPILLEGFQQELRLWPRVQDPFRQVDCLYFDPPLSRKACVKLRADITGLGGWLSYLFREWTAGRGVHQYWPGTEMPRDGRPKWDLVAEFINAALAPSNVETAAAIRQRWHSITARHSVRLHPWPREALREPQIV